jgi:hypothetical protein
MCASTIFSAAPVSQSTCAIERPQIKHNTCSLTGDTAVHGSLQHASTVCLSSLQNMCHSSVDLRTRHKMHGLSSLDAVRSVCLRPSQHVAIRDTSAVRQEDSHHKTRHHIIPSLLCASTARASALLSHRAWHGPIAIHTATSRSRQQRARSRISSESGACKQLCLSHSRPKSTVWGNSWPRIGRKVM